MLNDEQINRNKEEILLLLRGTNRIGVDNVIKYLLDTGFFYNPSSAFRHHNWKGGLTENSLSVCDYAAETSSELPKDSLIIAGILHDICKTSLFYFDKNGRINQRRHIHIRGHGYRSVRLLQCS